MAGEVKILHRFWGSKDGKPMPKQYQEYGLQWAELNPGWEIVQWSIADILLFPKLSSVFDHLEERDGGNSSIEYFVQVADVMGYALVERFGGVYTNCDIQPLRPLEELPIPNRAWASYENNEDGRIVNAIIGSLNKNDPFWQALLENLPARYFANPTAEMVETTGPAYLTDFSNARPGMLHVFPTETFNYVHWKSIPSGGTSSDVVQWKDESEIPPGVFGLHQWGHKLDGRSNRIEGNTQPDSLCEDTSRS